MFEPGPWDGQEYGLIDYEHPDLAPNVDAEWRRTLNTHIEPTTHATLVAGVIAAARNGEGSVGVAYDVTLSSHGLRNADDDGENADFEAIWNWADYDIANNSWGITGLFTDWGLGTTQYYYPLGSEQYPGGQTVTYDAMELAVATGRDGLGTAIVFGSGNERQSGHRVDNVDISSSRHVITVGAINAEGDLANLQIAQDPFSNPGASILVSAPGSNVTSTSRLLENDQGSVFGSDYEATQGTSFATPIVSGVVALMLQANPQLGYRDVQEILAYSAKAVDDPNTDWDYNDAINWNGGGLHYSDD